MSKVNTSCFEQELQMEYYFDNDIESNHTDESIEYYKKKNVVMLGRKFINFLKNKLFGSFQNQNDDKYDIYRYYP
jgi:hypothetical protein